MNDTRIRVGAVSYLNTVPLVWGMLHGPQAASCSVSFSLPSLCAERMEAQADDIGIVPVAEIARQDLQIVSDVGIACRGAVRSILLFSRVPLGAIRTLAADEGSRTSVQLARVILREQYGTEPSTTPAAPDLHTMLATSDAALVIGDPALRLEPERLPWEYLDLGEEWLRLTGLPMVFAAWASQRARAGLYGGPQTLAALTRDSFEFGRAHLAEIVTTEYLRRGVRRELADRYLSRSIRFEIGVEEQRGLQAFYELAGLGSVAAV